MNVVERIADLRATLDDARANGQRVGFVPTMGFLHEGHASLMLLEHPLSHVHVRRFRRHPHAVPVLVELKPPH